MKANNVGERKEVTEMNFKRMIAIIISVIILVSCSSAETLTKVTDRATFETLFNIASIGFETSHSLSSNNLSFIPGDVNDVYQMTYDEEDSFLQYSVTHGTDDIVGVLACYIPSGNATDEKSKQYIYLIYEVLYATGAAEDPENIPSILSLLGFYDNLADGDSNKISLNGLSIGYTVSSTIGFWFYVEI